MPHMAIEPMRVGNLRPYAKNARTHSKKQIKQIARSIERFGFTNPVLISNENEIIAGHGRVEAAKLLGIECVPTLRLSHLAVQPRAITGLLPAALVASGFSLTLQRDCLEQRTLP